MELDYPATLDLVIETTGVPAVGLAALLAGE
jgi:hypothetical protein